MVTRTDSATLRRWAAEHLARASGDVSSGIPALGLHHAQLGVDYLRRAREVEQAEAARIEAECAAFNAALAECADAPRPVLAE